MIFKFVTRTEDVEYSEDPEGFESHDSCADLMRVFCTQEGQPYSEPFVSIEVSLNNSEGLDGDDSQSDLDDISLDDRDVRSVKMTRDLDVFRTVELFG